MMEPVENLKNLLKTGIPGHELKPTSRAFN